MSIYMFKKIFEINKKLSNYYFHCCNKIFKVPDNYGPQNAWPDFNKILITTLEELYSDHYLNKPIQVLEIGAGQNSSFTQEIKEKYSLEITGFDLSSDELDKNRIIDNAVVYDATNPYYKYDLENLAGQYDLVVSKMFLEHINNPDITHQLIAYCLKPHGKAIHFHPTLYDPSFLLNKLFDHRFSSKLMKFLAPGRNEVGVFPAYYKNCRAMNKKLSDFFKSQGYNLLFERHYFGAEYFCFLFPIYFIFFHFFLLCSCLDLKLFSAYSIFCLEKVKA